MAEAQRAAEGSVASEGQSGPPPAAPPAAVVGTARTRLLDAGLELFGTVGYEATTITDLCREAHVSTRDFYRQVGDRISLFLSVFEREVQRNNARVAEALADAPPDAAVRGRIWMDVWLRDMVADPRRYRIMYTEAHGVDETLELKRRAMLRDVLVFSRRQAQLCAAARGVDRPEEYWEIPAICISGGAREALQQYMEGTIDTIDVDAIVDAYVRMAVLVVEHW